jgi:hypothetical protein
MSGWVSKMDFSHTSYPCHEYGFAAWVDGERKKNDGLPIGLARRKREYQEPERIRLFGAGDPGVADHAWADTFIGALTACRP